MTSDLKALTLQVKQERAASNAVLRGQVPAAAQPSPSPPAPLPHPSLDGAQTADVVEVPAAARAADAAADGLPVGLTLASAASQARGRRPSPHSPRANPAADLGAISARRF